MPTIDQFLQLPGHAAAEFQVGAQLDPDRNVPMFPADADKMQRIWIEPLHDKVLLLTLPTLTTHGPAGRF